MKQLLLGVIAFAAIGAGLLYVAGELGAAGVVIVGLVQVAVILGIARASTSA
jgi:hypothetical protein